MRHLVLILFLLTSFTASGQSAAGSAVIFNASTTALAGDVLYLQGSGFGSSPHVQYSFNDSNWKTLVPLTANSQAVMVQIPSNLTSLPDLIAIEVSADGSTWSQPVYINQAKAYSFDTDQIAPGGGFRIFGRNLLFSRTPTVRFVDAADGSSHLGAVNLGASASYSLVAAAPADIKPNHTYSVYVSNGYNGNGSSGGETSAATTLLGRNAGVDYWNLGVPWAADLNYSSNVYNIQNDPRLSLHSDGSGTSTTDASAINNAIWVASNAGGGIVYLPAGTYNLYFSNGCGITLLPRVAVMGASSASTYINYGFGPAPSLNDGGYAACFGTQQAGISDITFNNINQSGQWPQSAAGLGGTEIFLQRTNWNIGTAQWVVIQDATDVTVQNSSIVQGVDTSYNGPFSLLGSTNFVVRGNTIKYVSGALILDQSTNGVFENNSVIRDASQSAPSYIVTHVLIGNFANNLMVLGNNFSVTGGTLSLRNDGETIGSESGGAVRYDEFRGTVQSAGVNYISDGTQNFNYSTNNAIPNLRPGATLAIVGGQGTGQWSTVTSVSADGHTAFVAKPWTVLPNSGSTYATFDWGAANWIIANNNMSNNEKGIEFFDASIRDILITGNAMTNNGEILLSPTQQAIGGGLFNLVVNTQILGNTLLDNNYLRPAAISAVPREDQQVSTFGTSIIGLEIRNNAVTGTLPNTVITNTTLDDSKAISEGINLYWQWQTIGNFIDSGIPSVLGTVAQGNTLTNSLAGFELNSGDYLTVLASNVLSNVTTAKADVTLPGISHASVGTVVAAASAIVGTGTASSGSGQVSVFTNNGIWTTEQVASSAGSTIAYAAAGVTPAMGDYDGDGLVDCTLYSKGVFYIRPSSNPSSSVTIYFADPTDISMPGDYDGDGKTDFAVFRPSTGQWFYSPSSKPGAPNVSTSSQALSTDTPLAGDYDGDGKTDFMFYRQSTGTFYLMPSTLPGTTYKLPFCLPGDVAVPGDYDGDGKSDLAVYRPSNATFYYLPSSKPFGGNLSQVTQGQPGDVSVAGDFDGDGKSDFALWRSSNQTWYVIFSANPGTTVTVPMTGLSGTITPLGLTPNAIAVKASLTVN